MKNKVRYTRNLENLLLGFVLYSCGAVLLGLTLLKAIGLLAILMGITLFIKCDIRNVHAEYKEDSIH